MFGAMLGGWEIVLILLSMFVGLAFVVGIIVLAIYLARRASPPPPVSPAPATASVPDPPVKPSIASATVAFSSNCAQCGTPLPGGALAGLCPACLLKAGAAPDTVMPDKPGTFTPPSVPELAPLFPQLEIIELIGKGGMGAVYKARQKQLDRFVALKILPPGIGGDPTFAERFAREAKALAKLNHPGIVTLYEFGQVRSRRGDEEELDQPQTPDASSKTPNPPPHVGGYDIYFFLMEFVDGLNLRQLLHAGRVSAREALAIVPQICDALQCAHDQGIVHRDIKPENILLDRRGRVKVADFGLAKIVGNEAPLTPSLSPSDGERVAKPGEGSPQLTDAGKVMGTPQYMSPEQIHAPGDVDHRADIYALGVVFYQMLTGELPGKKLEPPSKKVSIDVRLDEIVLRALEKKPELRYQQASALKTQVETIASSSGRESAQTESKGDQTNQSRLTPVATDLGSRFSRTAIAGVCMTVLALVIFVLVGIFIRTATVLALPDGQSLPNKPATLVVLLLILAGTLCAFISTLFGWMAVAQIRRSAGKLHGLWLAVFDGLLFPLLTLDAVIFGLVWLVAKQFLSAPTGDMLSLGYQIGLFFASWLSVATFISAVVDWLIIRRVWRAVSQFGGTPASRDEAAPIESGRSQSLVASAATREKLTRIQILARSLVVAVIVWLMVYAVSATSTSLLPRSYAATARIKLAENNSLQNYNPYQLQTEFERMQSPEFLKQVADEADLKTRWKDTLFGDEAEQAEQMAGQLRGAMMLRPVRGTTFVEITFYSERPGEAADIANTIAVVYRAQSAATNIEYATPPIRPVRPNPFLNLALGVFGGGILGIVAGGLTALYLASKKAHTAGGIPAKRVGRLAVGFFLSGTLGTLLLMTVSTRHELALLVGSMALLLVFGLGLMSWRERSGKFVVLALGSMFALVGLVLLLYLGAFGPARQAAVERGTRAMMENLVRLKRAKSELNRQATTNNATIFGPVIERVLPDPGVGTACVLDFETGGLLEPPTAVAQVLTNDAATFSPATLRWLRDNSADAVLAPDGSIQLLEGVVLKPTVMGRATTWEELTPGLVVSGIEGLSEGEREASIRQPAFHFAALRFPAAMEFTTRERSMGVLQIMGASNNPRGVKIRYKLVQAANVTLDSPTKTILLTRETNQLVGATTDTRSVSVWSESTVLPGEVLRAIFRRPDGQWGTNRDSLFTRVRADKVSTSSSFNWIFKEEEGFGDIEAENAMAQIRDRFTRRPLTLKAFTPLELFCVTNPQGGTLAGYVEFGKFSPIQPDSTGQVKVSVQIQQVISASGPMIGYSATVPAGYSLRATASEGEAFTHTSAGPYDFNSSWHRGLRPGRPFVYPEPLTWNVPRRIESPTASTLAVSDTLPVQLPQTNVALTRSPTSGLSLPQRRLRSSSDLPELIPAEGRRTNLGVLPPVVPAIPTPNQLPVRLRIPGRPEFAPFDVVMGEPKLIFSITNGPGDVCRGFLELVGPTNAIAAQTANRH